MSNSESSSGIYKSKLFNFLNRRSQQLKDKSKTVLRRLQVASIWGVQIALYPVYLLIQAGRNFVFQLRESTATSKASSLGDNSSDRPTLLPSVDQPITQTLILVRELVVDSLPTAFLPPAIPAVVKKEKDLVFITNRDISSDPHDLAVQLSSIAEKQLSSSLCPPRENILDNQGLFIQGVASSINSRHLILVDINNQTLDILTPEQQQKLAQKIIWEVASYGYDRRRFLQSQRSISPQLPKTLSSKTLWPARWFWHLMVWVQRGEVAIAANLFQESTLLVNPLNKEPSKSSSLSFVIPAFSSLNIPQGTLQTLDEQFYQIEIERVTPASQWLNRLSEKLLPVIIYPEQLLTSRADGINPEPQPQENIWVLVQGAIAYFFGKKPSLTSSNIEDGHTLSNHDLAKISHYSTSSSNALHAAIYPSPKHQELRFSEDDWLTSEDLFLLPSQQNTKDYDDEDMIDLPTPVHISLLSPSNQPSFAQTMAHRKKRNNALADVSGVKKSKVHNLRKNDKKVVSSQLGKSHPQQIIPDPREHKIIGIKQNLPELGDRNYDWIETDVTSKGYVKHPLQRCLEILDSITLWIERGFGQLWRAIKRIVRV